MAAYDDSFGSMLIGSWLSSILYALVVTQAYRYFLLYPMDVMYRKILVLSTVFFCTVALVADYANVYLPMVTFWGDTEKVQKQYWPVPLFVTTSTFVGVLVNSFLISRFYFLSKNLWISILLSLLLITGASLRGPTLFAGSFMVAITLQEFSLYTSRDKAKTAALLWTISTAATDIGIAGALIWQLMSMKSCCSIQDTQSLIKRLIIRTVQTGSTTSVVAIITLVSYLLKNDSNVPTACNFLIAPLYALTLLANFNLRRRDTISVSGYSASEGNAVRISGIHLTVDPDPIVIEHPQHHNPRVKDDTESYGGKKVPDF
ncbi:hypothetical protein DFH08DRAFT_1049941 [Mycena albidolilacea]|uniref:DUF6534 domain-containing protein n=1 Tax=Mycena albidolilacea TaxID=1033008 RepID=A0AAD7EBH6_9AGAR|nr:hypothetical protein DFH08DRAFT_1049941 [Mycena albidolilacea]